MKSLSFLFFIFVSFFAANLSANEKRVDGYIVYYNAFNSSFLQPEIAKTYKIPRTGVTAVLNIAIHKANEQNKPDAISANVQGRVRNQLSQFEDLAFREIKEDGAIYYLADFQFRPQEETDIKISIRVPGRAEPIELDFDKKFYKD